MKGRTIFGIVAVLAMLGVAGARAGWNVAQFLNTYGGACSLGGVVGVAWEIADVRAVLGLRPLRQIVLDVFVRVPRRWIVEHLRRWFGKPKVVPLEGRGSATSSGSASMTLIRNRGATLAESVGILWRLVEQHDDDIRAVKDELEEERIVRAREDERMRSEAVAKGRQLVEQVTGAHHGRRLLLGVALIFAGVVLSTWGGWLSSQRPAPL